MLPSIALSGRYGRKLQRLRVQVMGKDIIVDSSSPHASFGRADENDVVIRGNLISRVHARIEINRNKIMLIDQSTNGTFVQSKDGEEAFVRRDSVQLKGEGMIGLGKVPESDSPQTIRYLCEPVPV
jgi:hypothetical protein